jgi:hypothetical protein
VEISHPSHSREIGQSLEYSKHKARKYYKTTNTRQASQNSKHKVSITKQQAQGKHNKITSTKHKDGKIRE